MAGNEGNGDAVKAAVHTAVRILQDANGAIYVDPDAQHYSRFEGSADLLSIYSREIEALRRIVTLLMKMSFRLQEILAGKAKQPINQTDLNEVLHYLEAATWNTSLIFDPERGSTLPDSKD